MINFDDVDALLIKDSRNIEQRTGTVLQADAQPREPPRTRKITQQHVGKQPRIDIAPTQYDTDGLSLEPLRVRKQRSKPSRTSPFSNGFFDLEQKADRAFKVTFADQNDIIDDGLNNLARHLAGIFDCDSFGERIALARLISTIDDVIH